MPSENTIAVSEVGPRDGLQIEKALLPTEAKIRLIDALSETGLRRIEAGAFVHPKIIPQMADSEAVFAGLSRRPGVRYGALVPNVRGAERAVDAGADDLKIGVAASGTFNELNIRMTTDQAVAVLDDIARTAGSAPVQLLGIVATAFGCPYEGEVSIAAVERLFGHLVDLGCPVIYLADTTGMANPAQIQTVVASLKARWPAQAIGLHLHNTRGLGLANALAGLNAGVRDFESSIGGLGGCPFAPRAVGNIATEDFVHMAEAMGLATRLDLDGLIGCAQLAQDLLGRTLPGMVMKAGKATTRFPRGVETTKLD